MTDLIKSIFISICLLLIEFFSDSFELLLIISFVLGSFIQFQRYHFLKYCIIQFIVLVILFLLNGLNSVVLDKFAQLTMNMNQNVLLALVSIISILTVSLPATSASILKNEIVHRRLKSKQSG